LLAVIDRLYELVRQVWFVMGDWVAPYPDKLPVYAAALVSYVAYDIVHYFLHFGVAFNDHARRMKVSNT
jgi:hypothetical protein